jgi:hypothetical protein
MRDPPVLYEDGSIRISQAEEGRHLIKLINSRSSSGTCMACYSLQKGALENLALTKRDEVKEELESLKPTIFWELKHENLTYTDLHVALLLAYIEEQRIARRELKRQYHPSEISLAE